MSIGSVSYLLPTNRLVFAASVISLLLLLVGSGNVAMAATIVVPAGGNLQAAVNAASCGDTIVLQAGATWVTPSLEVPVILLKNKPCNSGSWITIRTSDLVGLPADGVRVTPANASSMAHLVTNKTTTAIEAEPGASFYRLIGLDIKNDGSVINQALVNIGVTSGSTPHATLQTVPHDIEFDRCWIHSIEDGTNSIYGTGVRGFNITGANITIKNSRIAGFRGYYPGTQTPISSNAVLLGAGPGPYTVTNTYLEAWFVPLFTGGGPQWITNRATVSAGATTTQATLSNVANISVGTLIAFRVTGNPNFAYEVARVTGISGNTVTYVGQPSVDGTGNPLVRNPNSPGDVVWEGDLVKDVTITRNDFVLNPVVAETIANLTNNFGKGCIELKLGKNILIEGNVFSGPSLAFTLTTRNQTDYLTAGANPWATLENITIRNNWKRETSSFNNSHIFGIQMQDNIATSKRGRGMLIENNLFEGNTSPLAQIGGSDDVVFRHNTAVDRQGNPDVSMLFGYASANSGAILEDNIIYNGEYGMNCQLAGQSACWPSSVIQKNVIVDNRSLAQQDFQGLLANMYPAGNFYTASTSQIGFVNPSAGNWALSPTSPYKGRGTNGTDPGVDMVALLAAIGGTGPTTPTPTPNPSPTPTPTATPTPPPTPTPSPTPIPTPTPNTQLGESVLRAKRNGQDLSNQLASSGGAAAPGGGSALEMIAAETEAFELFIAEIRMAYAHFNVERQIYPAAQRIEVALVTALQRAIQADSSYLQGDVTGVRNNLRQAIDHLELSVVLILQGNVNNPIDVASYVVRQHYVDFLDREPEQSGNEYWTNQFAGCGTDVQCFEAKRIHVSAAFFVSIEFQQTGYFVHRLYKSSYGRVPSIAEFMPDNAVIGQGVIVGTADWEARLAANKDQFLQSWVQRADFNSRYASLTNGQYVGALIANLGVTIDPKERDALILDLASGWSRANVLGKLAQNEVFSQSEFNSAFVLMQYFGYLRRDPDSAGFNFWLNKLNQFGGNYQSADMVKAFLASQEYRTRFAL